MGTVRVDVTRDSAGMGETEGGTGGSGAVGKV